MSGSGKGEKGHACGDQHCASEAGGADAFAQKCCSQYRGNDHARFAHRGNCRRRRTLKRKQHE
jgi:hypothetical protein